MPKLYSSSERRSVMPWRLTTALTARGEQRTMYWSWPAAATGRIANRISSPSDTIIFRFTLSLIYPPPSLAPTIIAFPRSGLDTAVCSPAAPRFLPLHEPARSCSRFPCLCLLPREGIEWHFNALAGLAHQHIEPQAFAWHIPYLEFPQGIADHLPENLFSGNQQNRHIAQPFLRLVAVLDLPHQGHAGTAAFIIKPEIERVIPSLVEELAAEALLGAHPGGQGFAETVVDQSRRDAGEDLDLLGLLEDADRSGGAQGVVGDLEVGVAAGSGGQLMQQVSGAPALAAAGGEMGFDRRALCFCG